MKTELMNSQKVMVAICISTPKKMISCVTDAVTCPLQYPFWRLSCCTAARIKYNQAYRQSVLAIPLSLWQCVSINLIWHFWHKLYKLECAGDCFDPRSRTTNHHTAPTNWYVLQSPRTCIILHWSLLYFVGDWPTLWPMKNCLLCCEFLPQTSTAHNWRNLNLWTNG